MYSHSIACPHCGAMNTLIVSGDLAPTEEINCAKCPEQLGTWGALREQATILTHDTPNEAPLADQPSA